ncbi:MAG: hypothetical protein CMJ89_18280 [Planctomycetes bacterium]|jgi:hypothetical protein|nr:hypothetical protein [Planctomycetota bacterium]
MNVNALKGLFWVAALGVAGYLGFFIYDFLKQRPELQKPLSEELQKKVLEDVQVFEEGERDLVAMARVKEVFGKDFDWTGKPPPPPPKVITKKEEKQEAPKIAVADMLKVLYIFAHDTDPTHNGSRAWVSYFGVLGSANDTIGNRMLHVGDRLPEPEVSIEVKAITPEGVVFKFVGEDREEEVLSSLKYDSAGRTRIVDVAEGELPRSPTRQSGIRRLADAARWRPAETQPIGRNEYQLGTQTAAFVDQNYGEILSRDLRYRSHRDDSGQVDGVQVTHVTSGSIPSDHGVNKGDVIKSINGHKVTSVNAAINYVKSNSDTTSKWVVVIERQGEEITKIYHSPPE